MNVTKTVEIPASHRLTIDVPAEVPVGRAVITFAPAPKDADDDGLDYDANEVGDECPFCAAHRDPVTGNPLYKPEIYASMQEVDDMLAGKIPSTLRRFHSLKEMLEDLDRDDPDDDLDE
jgi:hypothetical protein